MLNFKKWTAIFSAIAISFSSLISFSANAEAPAHEAVTTATAADTAEDLPATYSISTLSELIYAAAHPTFFGKGDTIYLNADLDISQYNGNFTNDFKNFDPIGNLETDFNADFDGMGHTIFNYTETLPFFNGRVNGVIRNLTFENAYVRAGATQSSILMRTTERGVLLNNVHIKNSTLTTANDSYCGALIAFAQNGNKSVIIRNCSVINTHVTTTHTGSTYGIGLFMGRYRTGETLFIQNCIAADSSVSGITASNNGAGLFLGDVSKKSANGIDTFAVLNNIGIINCALKNYGSGSIALGIVATVKDGASMKATNIYTLGNMRSSQAGLFHADIAFDTLFYTFANSPVTLKNYKVDAGVAKITPTTSVSAEAIVEDFTQGVLLAELNQTKEENHLEWTFINNIPCTTSPNHAFTAGDVNNDGKINDLDVMTMLRILGNLPYEGSLNEKAMFLDGDSIVTMADLSLLMQKVAGHSVTLKAAPINAVVEQYKDGHYYFSNYTVNIISQNILHGGSSRRVENGVDMNNTTLRTERQRILMQECGYNPDIVILQEYRHTTWFNMYEKNIFPTPEYENHIVSRADPARDTVAEARELGLASGGHSYKTAYQPDERLAIFWRNDKYNLALDQNGNPIKGMFYFSDTPDVNSPSFGTENDPLEVYSQGVYLDNRNRICVWVKLEDLETGEEFYVYDFHFPNGMTSSEGLKAVALVNNKVNANCAQYGDAPAILGGDMNTSYFDTAKTQVIAEMGKHFTDVGVAMGNLQGTFPSFSRNITADGQITSRIDYFYTWDNRTLPLHYNVMEETFDANNNILEGFGGYNPSGSKSKDNMYNGYWASDHLGLYAEFLLDGNKEISGSQTPADASAGEQIDLPISLKLTGADASGKIAAGTYLTATVSLKEGVTLASLPLAINYDSSILSLMMAFNDPYSNAVMNYTKLDNSFSTYFYSTENISTGGPLITLYFKVLQDTALKDAPITASVVKQGALGITRFNDKGVSIPVYATKTTACQVYYGDVDGNGTVDMADAVLVLRHTVGLDTSQMTQAGAGELDGKDGLTVVDAQMILWYLSHPDSAPLKPVT